VDYLIYFLYNNFVFTNLQIKLPTQRRRRKWSLKLSGQAAALAVFLAWTPAADTARWIEGVVVHVRDGDTIVVGEFVLRLWGLHAPELRASGGRAARRWMVERALGRRLVCRLDRKRSFDRLVAVCFDAGGDLAAQLIAAGLGRDCPRFSSGRYVGNETEAGRRLPLPAYCRPRSTVMDDGAP
jgi:endonuclease YncB( thermonuclease family)